MEEPRLKPVNLDFYQTLRELVLVAIREAIIEGSLQPREHLVVNLLAKELGVSRTPVREAIRRLELEGFVIMVPRKGAYVSDISYKEIAEVYEVRAALDGLAAGLAAERVTEEELETMGRLLVEKGEAVSKNDIERCMEVDNKFHETLYKASRNERLVGIISNLREQIQRFLFTSLAYPGRMRESLYEHRAIIEALELRDVLQARHLAQEHVENAQSALLDALKKERGIL